MKKIVFIAAMIGALTVSQVSQAQPRINNRQYNQHQRIANGVHNGTVTRGEAHRLRMQQTFIRRDKRMALADGHMSPRERAIINHEQRHASHSIYRMKHNGRNRF